MAVLCGAVCGSFAGVVADRVPRGESLVSGRSRCRSCSLALSPRDLVPIISWCMNRGRCRICGARIGPTETIVEILTAAVFALCSVFMVDPFEIVSHWILSTGLIALSVIDVRTFRLPRRVIHMTALLGAPVLGAASLSIGETQRLFTAVQGAASALAAMSLLYVASRGRLGDGDVRLSALLGMFLGWQGLHAVFSGFLVSFHLGAIGGLVAMAVSRMGRSTAIPFGPYLAVGTLVTSLFDIDVLS